MLDFLNGAAYVDEQFVPIAEAKISILDWGFLHSDATYDVAHVWKGQFFRLDDHLDRFLSGIDKLHMSIPYSRSDLRSILIDCVKASGLREAYDRGGETAVVVDAQGNLVEGPGFNIFAVNGGKITTPARGVLEGITRRTVIELATADGYEIIHHNLSADKARNAEEVFVTSTAGGVMPVTKTVVIKRLKAIEAIITQTIEPVFNPIWVFLAVGETPGPWALLGGMVVLSSVTLHAFLRQNRSGL